MNINIQYRSLSSFLALIILYSSFYQVCISVYFIAYQDYIVKELCVQKDDQQGCNGKCYLMKKFTNKVSENNATTPPQNNKEFKGSLIFILSKKSTLNFSYFSDLESEKTEYHLQLKQSIYLEKETPPPKIFI